MTTENILLSKNTPKTDQCFTAQNKSNMLHTFLQKYDLYISKLPQIRIKRKL